jgi:flagellar protein FlaG
VAGLFEQEVDVDVSNLTKAGSVAPSSVAPVVTKAVGNSSGGESPAAVGNSLPDAGQARVQTEDPSAENPASPSSSEELNNLVDQVNLTLQGRSSDLKFTVAEGTDINIVRVEDAKTGELIRQFPSEEVVAFARALDESQQGTMLEEKA